MKNLENSLQQLQDKISILEPDKKERHQLLNKVISYSDDFLNNIADSKGYFQKEPQEDLSLSNMKESIESILNLYDNNVVKTGINAASGGHVGYIPGGGIFASSIADYLADITNEYAGVYFGSPGAVTIENEVINWLLKVFDFPENSVGNLTSGGSIANLIALTAARDKYEIKNEKVKSSVIYLSKQVHHCINKAIRIIGLNDSIIRIVDLDENHRIDTNDLNQKIKKDKENGLSPFLVIASAGTTDTGAIDPLDEIAEISKENNLWFHIDGAYGGFFILSDSVKHKFKGIEKADSLVIDPHKGLFLPYGLGAVIVKDKDAVLKSHHYTANYMQDAFTENSPINPADVSPELTKHFRGLRLWLPLKLYGEEPFKACLDEKILLTEYFRNKLDELGFKLGPSPDLSVSYFWYPKDKNQNEFNQRLLELIHKDGRVFLSSTLIDDKFVIRMAILSFRTKKETIDSAIEMIKESLSKLK